MEIIKLLQITIGQCYKKNGIYSALKLAWKIHNFLAAFRTVYTLIPNQSLRKRITYVSPSPAGEAAQPAGENQVRDLKQVQIELLPFYDDGEEVTAEKVHTFVETFNQRYFQYFIDPEKELLIGIRTRKLQMIIRGEKAYLQGFEDNVTKRVNGMPVGLQVWVALKLRDEDPLIPKIKQYSENRLAMRVDIPYQRTMLKSFVDWYTEITAPLALPASTAHYIA